jgi:hypothetical protein
LIGGKTGIYRKIIPYEIMNAKWNKVLFLAILQKIFLDTTRLLAENTNNLLQELWKYIEDGKIIQFAVLLLAAQEQIRGGCSSKINGSSKKKWFHTKKNGSSKKNGFDTKINGSSMKNGFDIINKCVVRLSFALKWEKGSHGMAQELLEERKTLIDCAWLLIDVISHAGEELSAYIQAHSEVSVLVYCGCGASDAFYYLRCL